MADSSTPAAQLLAWIQSRCGPGDRWAGLLAEQLLAPQDARGYVPGVMFEAPAGSPLASYADPLEWTDPDAARRWAGAHVPTPAWSVQPLPCAPPRWGVQLGEPTDRPSDATWCCAVPARDPSPAGG